MQFAVNIPYRSEFLPILVAFVSETARCLGATAEEMAAVALASEEAGLFIVDRFPGDGLHEQFRVSCDLTDDFLRLVFSNMGLPVDPENLPDYKAERPEDSIEGLGLFLIRSMVDHVEFVNNGRDGWRTVILKQLSRVTLPQSDDAEESGDRQAREPLRVVEAGPAHAPAIVELAYHTYGYSYSKEDFYYVERLRDAITSGRIRSFIAATAADRVMGHMAILRTPGTSDAAEVGAVMVQPEYRRSTGLLQLIKVLKKAVAEGEAAPRLLVANLVTTHALSQRASALFEFTPMALELSVHGQARFVDLAEEAAGQRESLLHAVVLQRSIPEFTLFVPEPRRTLAERLFARAGLPAQVTSASGPLARDSVIETEVRHEAELAIIVVHGIGADVMTALRAALFELEAAGMKTVFVRFPTWQPQPQDLDANGRALRLFFSGWVAETSGRWWMQYTRLFGQRFDFDRIELFDPLARELREYVANCYREAVLS